jgi:ubiquitin C-terminal hydrolase
MRAAYKRYLIGTPPPVLVIHLKRFQHISRTYMMSFSHGLKKLDDYVTFPEYLDLTPFLAPKKEDFGLGRGLSIRHRAKEKERCMYRLYAVVVHIGNMVCFFITLALVPVLPYLMHSLVVTMWHTLHFLPSLL